MREEHKLNKAIKQDGIDTQSQILDELKRRYPQYVEQHEKKQAPARNRRLALISAIAAAVVCVAVILPCAVLLPNKNNGSDNGEKENIRYCAQGEYEKKDVQYTIVEYRENNNLNFSCFDWYEMGEDIYTFCYTSNADNEVLCLEEQIYLLQLNKVVKLSITKANVYLSEFNQDIERSTNKSSVGNHNVKWSVSERDAVCILEDDGYRYFIQILEEQDENKLFKLVVELLATK